MSNTLFDLTLKCAIELGIVRQSVATGGSTNTIVDTNLLATLDDDYLDQGTAWITDTTDDAAPKSELSIISNSVGATGTATLQDAVTTAVAAGDRFAIAAPRYKWFELSQQINSALYMDGYIATVDTSLTTAAQQREYTLPAGAELDLRQVQLYTNKADTDRNIPRTIYNWEVHQTATGTQNTLVLNADYSTGLTIELTYATQHADLQVAADKLNEAIHPDRIVFEAAANAMRAYRDRTRLKHLEQSIEMLERKAELAKQRHPLPTLPGRQSKLTIVGQRTMDHNLFNDRNWRI